MEQITIETENTVCEKCNNQSDELFICEKCDCEFCSNCQAPYNKFTQIDFDCCKSCGEYAKWRED